MSLITPMFRANWVFLFKTKLNKLSGKQEYSVTALFPKGTKLTELKNAVLQEIKSTWGADEAKWPKDKEGKSSLKLPFKKQGFEKDENGNLKPGYEEGAEYCVFKSYEKPGIVDSQVKAIIDPVELYSGCWCIASVNPKAFNMDVNKGVTLWLKNIQKVKDGESLGGRTRPEEDFSAIEEVGTNEGVVESAEALFS